MGISLKEENPFCFLNYNEKEEIAIYENLLLKSEEFKKMNFSIDFDRFYYSITNTISKKPSELIIDFRFEYQRKNKYNILNYKVIKSTPKKYEYEYQPHPYIVDLIIFIHSLWKVNKSYSITLLKHISALYNHLNGSDCNYRVVYKGIKYIINENHPEFFIDDKVNRLIRTYLRY